MIAQRYATDTSQALHLKNSQRANVLFHNSPCCPEYSRTDMTMHSKNCVLTDRVKALEDQMLARLSCWKALFAAATPCVVSASKVQSDQVNGRHRPSAGFVSCYVYFFSICLNTHDWKMCELTKCTPLHYALKYTGDAYDCLHCAYFLLASQRLSQLIAQSQVICTDMCKTAQSFCWLVLAYQSDCGCTACCLSTFQCHMQQQELHLCLFNDAKQLVGLSTQC